VAFDLESGPVATASEQVDTAKRVVGLTRLVICAAFVIAGLTLVFVKFGGSADAVKERAEVVKNTAEALAAIAAGLWFLFRAIRGYFWSNAVLTVSAVRTPHSHHEDFVGITATVVKGEQGGSARLVDLQFVTIPETSVFGANDVRQFKRRSVTDGWIDLCGEPEGYLNLAPGDSMQFSAWCLAPSAKPVFIEVVLVAEGSGGPRHRGQWRSSVVALPDSPFGRAERMDL